MEPERSTEYRDKPNSIESHRNARGEWATSVKVYCGTTEAEMESAKELLDSINLRLLITYPPVDVIQAEILERRLQLSVEKASNGS
jgi:hypothetical protein